MGDDAAGGICLKRLQEFRVDTDWVEIVANGKTPVAYAFVTQSTGNRTIIYEHHSLPKIRLNNALTDLLAHTRIVLLDPEVTYLGKKIKSVLNDKVKIVYDCERWRDGIEDMMALADFFIPSSDFLDSNKSGLGNLTLPQKIFKLKEPDELVKSALWENELRRYTERYDRDNDKEFSSRWESWPKDKLVYKTKVTTSISNPESIKVKLSTGLYKIECSALDRSGKEIKAFLPSNVWVDIAKEKSFCSTGSSSVDNSILKAE